MDYPYIFLGDEQTATTTDLANATMALIEEFSLTPQDANSIRAILEDNNVTYK